MIEANGLTKKYGGLTALRDVTFRVDSHEVVGFLGPNGAGKTTTMRILTTFLPPTGGTATVAGIDVGKDPKAVRERIGYLPESPPLYYELNVTEYLRFVSKIKGVPRKAMKGRIEEMLEVCGLTGVRKRVCAQLSKGYKQRVGIAQAIIHKPEVIILDEPTSGLDPQQILEIRRLIKGLREKHTVILSTHILSEVTEVCSRVVVIAGGRTILQGELGELTREKTLEQRFLDAVSDDSVSSEEASA